MNAIRKARHVVMRKEITICRTLVPRLNSERDKTYSNASDVLICFDCMLRAREIRNLRAVEDFPRHGESLLYAANSTAGRTKLKYNLRA